MLFVNKITSDSVVDYAAGELKKYLRMMMPEAGDVRISYAPDAADGFRLGLMQDFGLDVSDAADTALDDILYIDCDERGGIIAGDNPRSVLLAVYEYLRQNGCRWLFPGVDGEFIPMTDIKPVKYRHKPSCRFRGWCNEGAESQTCMYESIDFAPKVGLNVYMMEFRIPTSYYTRYYSRMGNEENRPPEPVTDMQILQWKRACEAEIAKRGLQFHDIGHGFVVDAIGIDSSLRKWHGDNEERVPAQARKYLAQINGERRLFNNTPNFTNICMSNPEARRRTVEYIADYAANHSSDFLHFWLGDGFNAHCECDECRKKTPSDYYVVMLNELDRELTRRGLDTRIVFISYVDTVWAPLEEKIENQDRFTCLVAPIGRSYTRSADMNESCGALRPYERNKNVLPGTLSESFAYFEEWKRDWHGSNLSYEYHFWLHQYYDVAMLGLSEVINEDVRAYKRAGIDGIIEDGSQRSFFPSGLAFYTYARTLYDMELTAQEIRDEYFACAFGEAADEVLAYLEELSRHMPAAYLEGEMGDPAISIYYNPAVARLLSGVSAVTAKGREVIKKYYNSDYRICTASIRLLEQHADYCDMLAAALAEKAMGNDAAASELYKALRLEFGRREARMEACFDHGLCIITLNRIFDRKTNLSEPAIDAGS